MSSATISYDVVPIEGRFLSINGKVISCLEAATISVFDTSFHRGDGVFEVMRIAQSLDSRGATVSDIRCLDQHMERLQTSAKAVGCPLPSQDVLIQWLKDAVSIASGSNNNNSRSGCLRLIATKGNNEYHQQPSVVISWSPLPKWPDTFTLYPVLAPWHPAGLPGWETPIKWTSYGPNVVSTNKAIEAGYTDALLLSPHRVERPIPPQTWSDVDLRFFHVLDGPNFAIAFVEETRDADAMTISKSILHIPCNHVLGLLPSITQGRLIEIAQEFKNLVVKKNVYTLGQLLEKADEVFVMSTTRGLKTVTQIGEYEIPFQRPPCKDKQPTSWATTFAQLLMESG
jgi:branched-subunit amino acid aminotransferase/4-amino-4-deoxychorismate lyase